MSSALSSGILDGARTGFANAADIARNFLGSISSQLLNSVVGAGLKSIAPTFFGAFASGGEFVADRPGIFMAGEAGAERVKVEPLSGNTAAVGSGGGGETINLSLNVNGGLGGFSRSELKNLVKAAYLEIATKGNSVRRINAAGTRRSL